MSGPVKLAQLSGKVVRRGTEILMIFKVRDKYYPATEYNCELIETYWHTGETWWLDDLEDEME